MRKFCGCQNPEVCKQCRGTGYFGRTAIYELFPVDEAVRGWIAEKKTAASIRDYSIQKGMETLHANGMKKVEAGLTSREEIERVAGS